MKQMSELEKHYNKFNEDKRLNTMHGKVEFLTAIKYIEKYLKKDIDYCLAQIRVIMSSQLVFNPYIREFNQPAFQNVEDLAKIIESIQANKAGILIITNSQVIYSDYFWEYGMKNADNGTPIKNPVNKDPGDEIRALLKRAYPNQPEEAINEIWRNSIILNLDEHEDMPNTRSLSLYIPTNNKKAILTPNQLDTLLIIFDYLKPYIAYSGLSHVSSNYPQLTLFTLEDMHEILKDIVPIPQNSITPTDENVIGIPLEKLLKLIEQHKKLTKQPPIPKQ